MDKQELIKKIETLPTILSFANLSDAPEIYVLLKDVLELIKKLDEQQADKIDEPVKSEQTLKEKLLSKSIESHQVWFGRWYKKNHIEHDLMIAASRNYSKLSISISDKEDVYLKRRLKDPKTIAMLKEEMPSIKISYEIKESKDIFGRRFYDEKILFDWSEPNG